MQTKINCHHYHYNQKLAIAETSLDKKNNLLCLFLCVLETMALNLPIYLCVFSPLPLAFMHLYISSLLPQSK